jgi:hypothetical protein
MISSLDCSLTISAVVLSERCTIILFYLGHALGLGAYRPRRALLPPARSLRKISITTIRISTIGTMSGMMTMDLVVMIGYFFKMLLCIGAYGTRGWVRGRAGLRIWSTSSMRATLRLFGCKARVASRPIGRLPTRRRQDRSSCSFCRRF